MTPEESPAAANVASVCSRFLRRARPYSGRLLITLVMVLAATGSKAIQGYLVVPVIDRHGSIEPSKAPVTSAVYSIRDRIRQYFSNPAGMDLYTLATLAFSLSAAMFVFGGLKDYLTGWLTHRMVADLRNDVAGHLAYLPLRYHYDRKSGDLVSRITNDVSACDQVTIFLFDDAIVQPVMIAWAVAGLYLVNRTMAIIACAYFLIYTIVLVKLGRRMRKTRTKSLEHLGDMTGTMIQTFSGIKVVKAFNTEEQQVREFKDHNESYFGRLMKTLGRRAFMENMNSLFMGIAVSLGLVGSYTLLGKGTLSAGHLAFFTLAAAMINTSVREITKAYTRMVEASAGAARVFQLLDQPRETEHDAGEELPKVGAVEFKDVTFSYNSTPVLQDINLSVKPGEVVAVVGPSGAGKTTLCDLLCRFYDPQKGEIRMNGTDLKKVRRSSLLAHVAVVTQDTFLFNTSIGENIRYGKRQATQPEVEAAAKAAHIHDFIKDLEKGYDTVVGERGTKLSGGQRQRIAIARAVLRDPSILVLDEATSALDSESERAVQAALEQLLRSEHRITFVIAHRLSTIKNADRILVLDQGRLVEEGKHDELVAKGGVYASLYKNFTA